MKPKLFFIMATTILTASYNAVALAEVCGGRTNAAKVTGCATCTQCADIKPYIIMGCDNYYTMPNDTCGDNGC
mgnify:CR=1 FL=1|jgi:hypothetical protein